MINELEMIGWQGIHKAVLQNATKLSFISGSKPVPQVTSCGATSTARIAWPGLTRRLVQLLAGLCWMAFSTDEDACLYIVSCDLLFLLTTPLPALGNMTLFAVVSLCPLVRSIAG